MRIALAALLCTQLSGCWFVFLPVGAIADAATGAKGDHCVSQAAKVGDTVNIDGKVFVVKSLSGSSSRCNATYPIRAELTAAN